MRKLVPLLVLVLAACGSPAHLESCRDKSEMFMERLAKGDHNGAYELCDPNALSVETLRKIANNPKFDAVMNDYQGLIHGEGGQETRDANEEIIEIRLAPAEFKGHKGYVVHFKFRHSSEGWRIIAFQIDSP